MPVVKKAPSEVEKGKGQSDQSETDRADVPVLVKAGVANQGSEESIGPDGGEIGKPAHGEQVDDFLAGHGGLEVKGAGSLEV